MNNKFKKLIIEKKRGKIDLRIVKENFVNLKEKEVKIRIKYSNINYKDLLICNGSPGLVRKYPHTPGIDAAGTVVESKSKLFKKGEYVGILSTKIGILTDGTFSEYLTLSEKFLNKIPKNFNMLNFIIIGTAGLTAMLAIKKIIKNLPKNKNLPILVTGSSGSVGILSSFFLKSLGFNPVLHTSKVNKFKNIKYFRKLIYFNRKKDFEKINFLKKEYYGIIDNVGGKNLNTFVSKLHQNCSAASIGLVDSHKLEINLMPFILNSVNLLGVNIEQKNSKERIKLWNEINKIIKNNNIPKPIYKIIKFAELKKYIKLKTSNKVFGRIIIKFY